MDNSKPRLGRGLDALLGEINRTDRIVFDRIQHNPYQPRKQFDDEELASLAGSIKTHGVLQPLVVRKLGDGFQLIAGERRLRAARAAGLKDVPVHIVDLNDQQVYEAALVENIQRSDLNAIEKAQGFKDYIDRYKMTHDQLGSKLGLDRTTVANLLGLLNLPAEVQDAVRVGQISMAHAKVLKGLTDTARQADLCREIILKKLSVHGLEQLVKEQRTEPTATAPVAVRVEKTAHVAGLENDLRQRLACRVEIKVKAKEKGQIVIAFDSNDDFERIVGMLKG